MGIENHNFQSLLSDSSFFRSHSMSENKNELAANPNLFTEDEVSICLCAKSPLQLIVFFSFYFVLGFMLVT